MDHVQATISVREAIASVLRCELHDVSDDTRLFDDLAFDSTSIMELLVRLEDRIGVVIDPEELNGCVFHTVGTITDYVTKNLE